MHGGDGFPGLAGPVGEIDHPRFPGERREGEGVRAIAEMRLEHGGVFRDLAADAAGTGKKGADSGGSFCSWGVEFAFGEPKTGD